MEFVENIATFDKFESVCIHAMERPDKNKPLTPELKGSLITLYNIGFSYAEIAEQLDIHVSQSTFILFVACPIIQLIYYSFAIKT